MKCGLSVYTNGCKNLENFDEEQEQDEDEYIAAFPIMRTTRHRYGVRVAVACEPSLPAFVSNFDIVRHSKETRQRWEDRGENYCSDRISAEIYSSSKQVYGLVRKEKSGGDGISVGYYKHEEQNMGTRLKTKKRLLT